MRDEYRKRYTQQKSNAKMRGVEFLITFEEWKRVWDESGCWELRGKGRGKYCMSRHGDIGPYSIGNVSIKLNEENLSEGNLGRVPTVETRQKISQSNMGKSGDWCRGDKNYMRQHPEKSFWFGKTGFNNPSSKAVSSPLGIYGSTKEMARITGIKAITIQWRCRNPSSTWKEWLYLTDTQANPAIKENQACA